MPKELLPPEGYVHISTHVLFDLGLAPVVRDTYVSLRALAWGSNETPELSWEQLCTYTGKQRPTVYRHMLTLVTTGVIHWRTASVGTIIVTFTDGLSQKRDNSLSQKREMPIKSLSLISKQEAMNELKLKTPHKKKEILKNETTVQTSTTAEIQAEYVKLLGYPVDDWAAGEASSAKKIAAKYTVSQFREFYVHLKNEKYWRPKRLRLRNIVGEIDEYFYNKSKGRPTSGDSPPAMHQPVLPEGILDG